MHSLVYYSVADDNFDEGDLGELADRARKKNRNLGITGFLYFDQHLCVFIQYLEGSKDRVDNLMKEIEADDRHEVQQVVVFDYRQDRLLDSWDMRHIRESQFRTIGLEDVLQQTIKSIKLNVFEGDQGRESAERLVTRIAESKRRFDAIR